jgi:SSS family solute:Na+ symporter
MNLHWIDWLIVGSMLAVLIAVVMVTRVYTRSVADFLAANRCAGRYIIALAEGMAAMGVISIVATWEQYYQGGFGAHFWTMMLTPIGLILAMSGWIVYRFRETRAMTMAQFFEMRYSKRFRIFAGTLAWGSGVVNYGVFPAVTGRFFIYFCGLPIYSVDVLGVQINLTLAVVMAILLAIALYITLSGGQIAVMVTDFLQFQVVIVVFVVLTFFLIFKFGWGGIITGLENAPPGHSMLHPFEQGDLPDFNPMFFVMMAFLSTYSYMTWQGSQGYNVAARSPHEAKMGRVIGFWRAQVFMLVMVIVPVVAYAVMNNPEYAAEAQRATAVLEQAATPQLQTQMTTPVLLSQMLPVGLMGLVATVMLAAAVSTDDTYLHSWGSVFIQDVLLPLRGKPLAPDEHLRWLRRSIIGVAVFSWCFSLLFPLNEYIFMWFSITGAIYLGGAGTAVIGGLYWKRGTTSGAWAGMITGSVLSVSGIVLNNIIWPSLERIRSALPDWAWLAQLPAEFPLNGVEMATIAAFSAMFVYVTVSLLTPDPRINMDKLLHRGAYAVAGEHIRRREPKLMARLFGMGSEFTKTDRMIYYLQIGWIAVWTGLFIVITVWNLTSKWSVIAWTRYWLITTVIVGVVSLVTVVWFLIGGTYDIIDMIRRLRQVVQDANDDGVVRESFQEPDQSAP